MSVVLETPRLVLREMAHADLDFLAAMLADPEVMRFYPKPLSRQESRAWIERQLDRYERDGYGFWLALAKSPEAGACDGGGSPGRAAATVEDPARANESGERHGRRRQARGREAHEAPGRRARGGPGEAPMETTEVPIGQVGLLSLEIERRPEPALGYLIDRPHWRRGFATEAAAASRDYAFTALGKTRLVTLIRPENEASLRVAAKIGMRVEGRTDYMGYEHLILSMTRDDIGVSLRAP